MTKGLSFFSSLPTYKGEQLILPIMWFDDEIRMSPDAKLPLMLVEALATPSAMVLANGVLSGLALAFQMALALGYLGWKRHFFDDFYQQQIQETVAEQDDAKLSDDIVEDSAPQTCTTS